MPNLRNGSKGDSNPGSVSSESFVDAPLSSVSRLFLFFHIPSHFYVRSMFLMRLLQLTRSCSSSPDSSLSGKSFMMLSNHLRFGLPLLLFPGTSITITPLPTYYPALLNTRPYHFNLLTALSWIFLPPSLSL